MIDYNHNMGEWIWRTSCCTGTWSRVKKKKTNWYLKLFKRLLNSTVLNSFVIYRQVTGGNTEQPSYRIQLVEGVFMIYAHAAETRSVPGWQASDNTVPQLTERHFLKKVSPKTEKSKPQRRCVVCSKHRKKENFSVLLPNMWCGPSKIALSCITWSSINEVMIIILLHLYSFKISLLKF